MHDRHGPWIAIAWSIGVTFLAVALFSTWHAPGRPDATPPRTPIASINPTDPMGR